MKSIHQNRPKEGIFLKNCVVILSGGGGGGDVNYALDLGGGGHLNSLRAWPPFYAPPLTLFKWTLPNTPEYGSV